MHRASQLHLQAGAWGGGGWGQALGLPRAGAAVGEVESRQRAPRGAQPQGLLELGDGRLKLTPGLSLWRTLV